MREPYMEYEVFDLQQQRQLAYKMSHYTCGECAHCRHPMDSDISGHEDIGYCPNIGEFVHADLTAEEMDCEEIEPVVVTS